MRRHHHRIVRVPVPRPHADVVRCGRWGGGLGLARRRLRVGAAMRRGSLAGFASFTGFGGAACTGFGSAFFSTGFSSGCGSSVTSMGGEAALLRLRSRGVGAGVSTIATAGSSAPPARAPVARRRSRFLRLFGFCLVGLRLLGLLLGPVLRARPRRSAAARSPSRRLCRPCLVLRFRRGSGIHLLLALRRRDAGRCGRANHGLDGDHLHADAGERHGLAPNAMNSPACNASDSGETSARRRRPRERIAWSLRIRRHATAGAARAFPRGRMNGTTLPRSAPVSLAAANAPRARSRPRSRSSTRPCAERRGMISPTDICLFIRLRLERACHRSPYRSPER